MFIATLIIIAKKQKQPECSLTDGSIKCVVWPYNAVLFCHKKESSTDTCYNMGELWKHYSKLKKERSKR